MRDVEYDSHAAFRAFAELAVGEDDGDAAQCERRDPVQRVRVADGAYVLQDGSEERRERPDECAEDECRPDEYRLRKPAFDFFANFVLRPADNFLFHFGAQAVIDVLPVLAVHRLPFFRRQI